MPTHLQDEHQDLVHWLQNINATHKYSTFFPNTVKNESVGGDIIKETFQMPLDSEVEAN